MAADPKKYLLSHEGEPGGLSRVCFEYGRLKAKHKQTATGSGAVKKPKMVPSPGKAAYKWVGVTWTGTPEKRPRPSSANVPSCMQPKRSQIAEEGNNETAGESVKAGKSTEANEDGVVTK